MYDQRDETKRINWYYFSYPNIGQKNGTNLIQYYETSCCDKKPNARQQETMVKEKKLFSRKKNQNTLQLKQV